MTLDEQPSVSNDDREALEFLRQGRSLRGLSPLQFRRVENRLSLASRARPRRRWVVALAGLGLVLIAGSALARVTDLSRLPVIGPLLSPLRSAPRKPRLHKQSSQLANATPESAIADSTPAAVAPVAPPSSMPPSPGAPLDADRPNEGRAPATPASGLRSPAHPRSAGIHGRAVALAGGAAGSPARENSHAAPATTEPSPVVQDLEPGQVAKTEPRPAPVAWSQSSGSPSTAPSTSHASAEKPALSEGQSFSAAVAEWNRHHDARAALAALDAHERRFRGGQMQLETNLLRAEILLREGREQEGLALLDGVSLPGLPRGRELETVRGELRIKFGRCADGRRDLDRVLAKDKTDELGRRATRALALCP